MAVESYDWFEKLKAQSDSQVATIEQPSNENWFDNLKKQSNTENPFFGSVQDYSQPDNAQTFLGGVYNAAKKGSLEAAKMPAQLFAMGQNIGGRDESSTLWNAARGYSFAHPATWVSYALYGSNPIAATEKERNKLTFARAQLDQMTNEIRGTKEGEKAFWSEGGWKEPSWYAERFAELAPSLSLQLASAAGGGVGMAVMTGAQTAASQYEAAEKRLLSKGVAPDKAAKEAAGEALKVGIVTAAIDKIGFSKLFSKAGSSFTLKKGMESALTEAVTETAQEFSAMVSETGTDTRLGLPDANQFTWENVGDRLAPAGVLGALTGPAFGGSSSAVGDVTPRIEGRYSLTPEDATRLVRENPEAAQAVARSSRAGVKDFAEWGVERGQGNRKEATAQRKKFQEEVKRELDVVTREARQQQEAQGVAQPAGPETSVPNPNQTDVPTADTQAPQVIDQTQATEEAPVKASEKMLARRIARALPGDTNANTDQVLQQLRQDPEGLKQELEGKPGAESLIQKIEGYQDRQVAQQERQPDEIGRPTAGMGVSIPTRVGKRRLTAQVMRGIKRWGTSLGLSNAETRRLTERKAANLNAEQIQAQSEHANYIKAVKDAFGKPLKKLDAATKEELGRVINDRNVMYSNNPSQYTNLPEKILVPLRAFRRHIDRLSQELIDIGVLSEELEIVIDENTGEYTARSYQMWDDPTYGIHKIPKQILDDAIAWFQQNLEQGSPRDYGYVKNLIDLYFNSKGQKNIKLSGPPGRNDLTSLMKRKDIPEPLRKLMGEHKDPGFNAVRTITKLAYMVETARFQRDLLELGEGRFLFSQDDPNLPPGMESLGSSPSLGVLANYAADPGLAEVIRGGLEAQNKVSNFVWRYLSLGSAFSKLAATKYSPASGGRNAISGLNFMVKNGIFEPYRAGKAFWKSMKFHYRDAGVLLKGKAFDQKNLELAKEYQNVVGEEVRLNELKHFLKVAASKPEGWVTKFFDIDGAINATENPAWEAVLRSARYVDDIATKFWLTGDTLWKIAQYEVEKDRLRSYRKDLSESEVKDLAADIVKDTTPTYSRVLQWVQALRKNPLIAPFPSFTGEIYRNNLNISKQAFQEWRYAAKEIQESGVTDPAEFMAKFVKHPATYIGFSRFMGLMAGVAGFAWAMNAVGKALTGVTDEEEKALGEMDPEWAKGNWWTYNPFDPKDEQGNPNRVDISYIHTDNTVIKPWIALLRTGDDVEFVKQLIDPFTGADIFFDAFSEAGQNWDSERKRPVYNESLYEFPVNPQSAMHVGKSLSPGLARSYDQISDAVQGKVRNDSKILSVPQAISSSLGLKIYSNDPLTQIGYAASDFKRKERENKSVFQTMARLPGDVSTEELVDAFVTMERARQNNFERMEKKFNAAITLRNPKEVVTATAEPLSEEDQKRFLAGLFKPYQPTDAFLKSVPQRKRAQVVEAIQLGRERIAAQQSEADKALAQPPAQ